MREVSKVSCSLPGLATLASCLHQEETKDKRVPVGAAGSGPLAGKLVPKHPERSGCQLSTQVVRMSVVVKKSPHQSHYLLQEGGPFPGPRSNLLFNSQK